MLLAAALAAGWLIAAAAPETPIGAMLHRWLVAAPAAWLGRITRGQVMLTLGLALLLSLAAWLGQDALNIAAWMSPELVAAIGSVEFSVWIDALAGALLAWSATRASGLIGRPIPRRPTVRARRTRRSGARRPAANDDGDGPVRLAA